MKLLYISDKTLQRVLQPCYFFVFPYFHWYMSIDFYYIRATDLRVLYFLSERSWIAFREGSKIYRMMLWHIRSMLPTILTSVHFTTYYGDIIWFIQIAKTCCTHLEDEKFSLMFILKTWKEKDNFGDLSTDEIILKFILKKYVKRTLEFMWLRTGADVRLLGKRE